MNEQLPPRAMVAPEDAPTIPLLICFSHLRWDFVFQRPQHLMSRFAQTGRVLFWEEPDFVPGLDAPRLKTTPCERTGVVVLTPQLRAEADRSGDDQTLRALLDALVVAEGVPTVAWYYTPMMLPFSAHLAADCTVYDCMDELANFRFAPPTLLANERALLAHADLVFTGGHSLFEAKRGRHADVHAFPSGVDRAHFAAAQRSGRDPADQAGIAAPRLGYYGVIDERIDLDLLAAVADARPGWSIVMVGPLAKIGEHDLPRRPNIHYLGAKCYDALPDYLRGWNAALMPFAMNEATRFISPTKTPEYLAAGKAVVSTPVVDVIRQYGAIEAVRIAATPDAFVAACEAALALDGTDGGWRDEVDAALAGIGWDRTFAQMRSRIEAVLAGRDGDAAADGWAYDVTRGTMRVDAMAGEVGVR